MKFIFRADASIQIGSGHIMRCLTLANALREQGHSAKFITRAHVGHLADFIEKQGFECILLPEITSPNVSGSLKHSAWLGTTQAQDFADCSPYLLDFQTDWIVCDHYALSAEWEHAALAATGAKLLVIDDLHDREHIADVLLDQNLGHTAANYLDLIGKNCRVLAGTRYALLRDEFSAWRERSLARRINISGCLQNVLLNLGGVDKDNITLKILKSLEKNGSNHLNLTVVMGATAPHIATIREFAENAPFPCQVIVNANNMAEIMAQSDWAIGAAGSTSWERCCLGLPTILLILADNQRTIAKQLQEVSVAVAFDVNEIGTEKWYAQLKTFRQPENLAQMSAKAAALCDGLGVVRVVNHLEEISKNQEISRILTAHLEDSCTVFEWRNHAAIRQFMFNTDELVWENHAAWFAKQLHNPDFKMLIYYVNNLPQGYISFTRQPENVWEWGFYTAPDCPRGHGSRMGRLALAWAFAELGAHAIRGRVLPHNVASLRLHEKLGFFRLPEKEGVPQFELWANQFEY